ncbi:MAG: hypothetical protein RMZ42_06545 [Nostoc sp. DedQUE05]|uniref:hypothetical protein n=1 Tax=Nostoc sp. DedQUE05 TaxID=3075391 RepID=UPI002AD4664D|nr:hypothetical protein [Nostoc sp. DedQUE05]MDZ8091583.1 hypothetical protein [Nostoc sp. DedQUE05]
MNQELEYSYFVYGKFVGINSGYCLVARTANLTDEEQLKTMAEETHCFWGAYPPQRRTKAVGIFLQENNLVLMKVETAVDKRGQEILSGHTEFNHSLYVFIPLESLAVLRGRTFQLLSWIFQHPIPLFRQFEANLPLLQIPPLEQPISYNQEEVNKIQRCFSEADTNGQPLLISALAALINGKRLIFTGNGNVSTKEFVESILLLLPAAARSTIAVASGTLDEEFCNWAQLIIKSNSNPEEPLVDNLIWLNHDTRTFEGYFESRIFQNYYLNDFIYPIVNAQQKVQELIQELDVITDSQILLENLADSENIDIKLIARLISLLPNEQKTSIQCKYLSGLSINKWQEVIPVINDEQELVFAWDELTKTPIIKLQQCIPIILDVWKRLSVVEQIKLLQKLQNHPDIAEILLKNRLVEESRYEDTILLQEFRKLCKSVVVSKFQCDWSQAWQLATNFATKHIFQDKTEQFWLLDAVLASEIPVTKLYNCFNFKFATLVPHLNSDQIRQSNLYAKINKNAEIVDLFNNLLIQRNAALVNLHLLANVFSMNDIQQDDMYVEFLNTWHPSYEEAKDLLVEMIRSGHYSLNQTFAWFENKKLGLSEIFSALKHTSNTWDTWDKLASILYENPQEYIVFIDSLQKNNFCIIVFQKCLPIIANDENFRRTFLSSSCAWKVIKIQDLSQILAISSQYVETLVRCLAESDRFHWIAGDVLHYLCQNWITHKQVDSELKTLLTSPSVTKNFSNQDWLELQTTVWQLEFEIQLPSLGRVILSEQEKIFLRNQAITVIKFYTQPETTQSLLNDCEVWGLDLIAQIEILKATPLLARSIELILNYLSRDSKAIIPNEQQLNLLEILLQTSPRNQLEVENLKTFSVGLLAQFISASDWNQLKWWRDITLDQQLYIQYFTLASQIFIQNSVKTTPYLEVLNLTQKIKNYSLEEESHLILKAFWDSIPEPVRQVFVELSNANSLS